MRIISKFRVFAYRARQRIWDLEATHDGSHVTINFTAFFMMTAVAGILGVAALALGAPFGLLYALALIPAGTLAFTLMYSIKRMISAPKSLSVVFNDSRSHYKELRNLCWTPELENDSTAQRALEASTKLQDELVKTLRTLSKTYWKENQTEPYKAAVADWESQCKQIYTASEVIKKLHEEKVKMAEATVGYRASASLNAGRIIKDDIERILQEAEAEREQARSGRLELESFIRDEEVERLRATEKAFEDLKMTTGL